MGEDSTELSEGEELARLEAVEAGLGVALASADMFGMGAGRLREELERVRIEIKNLRAKPREEAEAVRRWLGGS